MPTGNEIVQQRGLNGEELKAIMIRDFTEMLNKDAMFAKRIEYARAAYRIKFQVFTGIPSFPEHANQLSSAPPPKGFKVDKSGGREALATPETIKREGEAPLVVGQQRDRVIDSPNLARIENDLPITVQRRDPEKGTFVDVPVNYSVDAEKGRNPDLNPAHDTNVSEEEWK